MFATLDSPSPASIGRARGGGRGRNVEVQQNFLEVPDPTRKGPQAICKHCHHRRAWQTTNNQKHLDGCKNYRDFVAAGEPEDELQRLTESALSVMVQYFGERPAVSPLPENAVRRPFHAVREPVRQEPRVVEERLPSGPPYAREFPPPVTLAATPANQREQMLEATLGMVWSALVTTGSPEAQSNTALWNLVNTIAPNALKLSQTTPRHAGLPGQYNTPAYGQSTSTGGAPSDSAYRSGGRSD